MAMHPAKQGCQRRFSKSDRDIRARFTVLSLVRRPPFALPRPRVTLRRLLICDFPLGPYRDRRTIDAVDDARERVHSMFRPHEEWSPTYPGAARPAPASAAR